MSVDKIIGESLYADELHAATEIAQSVGDIALQYHNTDLQVDRKIGNEPVTIADRLCSEYIVEELQRAFPEDTIVSEEVADSKERLRSSRVWYVDPIDGTKDYIRGANTYCIMIGLAIDHVPMVGVVYQPNYQSLIFACQGSGAWSRVSGTTLRLRVSPTNNIKEARHFDLGVAQSDEFRSSLGIANAEGIGSIGLKMCAIAASASDVYINPATHCSSWDTCAPQVILQEAGGEMSNLYGESLSYNNPDTMRHQQGLVATNGHVHSDVVARVAALFPKDEEKGT